jgi:hypothetical protein
MSSVKSLVCDIQELWKTLDTETQDRIRKALNTVHRKKKDQSKFFILLFIFLSFSLLLLWFFLLRRF